MLCHKNNFAKCKRDPSKIRFCTAYGKYVEVPLGRLDQSIFCFVIFLGFHWFVIFLELCKEIQKRFFLEKEMEALLNLVYPENAR